MQPLEEVNLDEVVKDASAQLIHERYDGAVDLVKKLFSRVNALTEDIKRKKAELKKVEDKLSSNLAKVEKVKLGDWSALNEKDEQPKEDN